MSNRRNRYILWLALMVVLIASASVYSLIGSYRSEVASHRRVLVGRGQTVLDALKAGILAHGRMGRYRGERLSVIFDELARNPDILALELRDPEGTVLASGGLREEIPQVPPKEPHWYSERLVMASHVDLLSECGHGGGGRGQQEQEELEDWTSFSAGVYTIVATLSATDVYRAVRRHQLQLAISAGVLALALGLGVLAVVLLLKRTEMAVELERERERARRQEQVARLGAGLAHETKNPLGIVRGLAQSIGDCSNHRCPIKDRAKSIVDEVDRVIGGINSFLALSRPQEAVPTSVNLDQFFESFLPLVQMDASAAQVDVAYTPSRLRVYADEDLLRRALLNLILNALRASEPGQTVRVLAKHVDSTDRKSTISLYVSDTGCGIAPDDLPRVTEPYFTRFSGGSGLGLSIVEQITTAHGWQLRISSHLRLGTQVVLEGIKIVESP